MGTETPSAPVQAKWMYWLGWVLAAGPVFMLCFSAYMKLSKNPQAVDGFAKMGYPSGALITLGVAELGSTILYLVPQTSVLGAILLTGYLGGAVDVHTRNGDSFGKIATPIVFGILIWGSLLLRDPRIRALIPFNKK